MHRGHDWLAGTLFSTLLCMKHLFLFCGPVFFVHILRHWCAGVHGVGSSRGARESTTGRSLQVRALGERTVPYLLVHALYN